MAKRINLNHLPEVRSKIQASQIVNRLQSHINGEIHLENSQVNAAKVLLAKTIPDLSSITLEGSEENPIRIMHGADKAIIDRFIKVYGASK